MENPPYVPYQAYKSKRHNRVLSASNIAPNGAPAVQVRPAGVLTNGHTYSEPVVSQTFDGVADAEKRSLALLNGRNTLQRPVSMIDTLAHLRQEPTPELDLNTEKSPVEKSADKPLPPSSPAVETPSPVSVAPPSTVQQVPPPPSSSPPVQTPPPSAVPLPVSPLSQASSPKGKGRALTQSPSAVPGPSAPSPTLSDRPLASPRKSSTFRHVPLRPAARPNMPSSPLRPASMHVQSSSMHLTSPKAAEKQLREPTSGLSSAVTTPTMTAQDRALPPIPALELQSQQFSSLPSAPSPTPVASISAPMAVPQLNRASTLRTPPVHEGTPGSASLSTSPALTPSTSTSTLPSTSRAPARSSAPYRPGFQPKGVYRPRTDEFVEARNQSRDAGRIERTRLERRLEKLINLHFPLPGQKKEVTTEPRPTQQNRRASSFWDLDLKNKSPSDLWREMVQSPGTQGAKNDIRAAEQKITPWEDDASVSQCPLCTASFHPLTNRKHHCRLCGRIVCSLPVKYPQRPETCSLLFVVDQSTGRIEEVGEGVDYGVRRRSTATPGRSRKGETISEDEKFLKGVRICRDCRPVLLRQQYRHEMSSVPLFSRLYEAFIILEKEIEDELPLFQELIVNLSKQERPTPEAAAARKRLLEAFSQYDALAKRIRKLPCPPGGSQDRIQNAIISRANLFLQKHMFPLQSLPKPKKAAASPNASSASPAPPEDQIIDPDSEVARVLQPLLEQEALLETFVEEAKAHRKFEDVKALKNNLREIRAEIERILANAEVQSPGRKKGAGSP